MSQHNPAGSTLLTEPVPIFETFCSGIAEVTDLGSAVRITCWVDRPVVGTSATERAVVARLIRTPEAARSLSMGLDLALAPDPGGLPQATQTQP